MKTKWKAIAFTVAFVMIFMFLLSKNHVLNNIIKVKIVSLKKEDDLTIENKAKAAENKEEATKPKSNYKNTLAKDLPEYMHGSEFWYQKAKAEFLEKNTELSQYARLKIKVVKTESEKKDYQRYLCSDRIRAQMNEYFTDRNSCENHLEVVSTLIEIMENLKEKIVNGESKNRNLLGDYTEILATLNDVRPNEYEKYLTSNKEFFESRVGKEILGTNQALVSSQKKDKS
jgi:hypothetical protein